TTLRAAEQLVIGKSLTPPVFHAIENTTTSRRAITPLYLGLLDVFRVKKEFTEAFVWTGRSIDDQLVAIEARVGKNAPNHLQHMREVLIKVRGLPHEKAVGFFIDQLHEEGKMRGNWLASLYQTMMQTSDSLFWAEYAIDMVEYHQGGEKPYDEKVDPILDCTPVAVHIDPSKYYEAFERKSIPVPVVLSTRPFNTLMPFARVIPEYVSGVTVFLDYSLNPRTMKNRQEEILNRVNGISRFSVDWRQYDPQLAKTARFDPQCMRLGYGISNSMVGGDPDVYLNPPLKEPQMQELRRAQYNQLIGDGGVVPMYTLFGTMVQKATGLSSSAIRGVYSL
ncbi:MAG: hypothetical protein WCO06_07465, partial [Candidatus Roizmanbacteria bacterium]